MQSHQSPWVTPETAVADLIRLRIRGSDYAQLRDHLIRPDNPKPIEHAAYLVAGTQEYERQGQTVLEYLVRDVRLLDREEYLEQGSAIVRFDHTTIRSMMRGGETDHALVDDMAVLMCHSHPRSTSPRYSGTDNANEPAHMAALTGRLPGPHGSLIFGREGLTGRAWASDVATIRSEETAAATPFDEIIVYRDRELKRLRPTDSRLAPRDRTEDQMRDRQALLHGPAGNQQLGRTHVAVVGAGGLGSLIVQSLARLGVGELTVVDPDVIEESNRSRVVGSEPTDAGAPDATPEGEGVIPAAWAEAIEGCGTPKAEVLQRMVERIDPNIAFRGIYEEVQAPAALEQVVTADIIITGTDTATSRRFISEAAQQYLRPLFNAGTDIDITDDTGLRSIATGFQLSGVNHPCLDCMGEINEDRIDAEGVDKEDLEYGLDLVAGEQPSVITINQEPAQRLTYAVHRYVTGLLADRRGFRTGTYSFTADRLVDTTDTEPDCSFCDGTFTGAGDRGVSIAKDQLHRAAPSNVETGIVAELSLSEFEEETKSQQGVEQEATQNWLSRTIAALSSLLKGLR